LEQVKASTTSHEIWTSVRAGSASIFKMLIKVEKYRNTEGVEGLRLVTRHHTDQQDIALPSKCLKCRHGEISISVREPAHLGTTSSRRRKGGEEEGKRMTPIMYVLLVLTILSVVLHCRLQAMAASLTELQLRADVFRNHMVCTEGTCTLPPYTPRHHDPTVLPEVHLFCAEALAHSSPIDCRH
jgi:hypothetical protein